MTRIDPLALAARLACLALSLPASAGEVASTGVEPPDETIVITATRTSKSIGRVGSSITVIDAAEIERYQDRLVIDALERVPGLTVRRDGDRPGARTSVFIRGADSDQTLVLLDGVRLHDPSAPNREAFLDHLGVEDIERIEVLAGPQSVLYGSDAIGGVINIVTRRGDGPPAPALRFEGGSYSTFDTVATLRGGGARHHYSASVSRTDSDGFSARSSPLPDDDDGYARTSAFVRLGLGDEVLGIDGSFRLLDAETELDLGAAPESASTDSRQYALVVAPHLTLLDGRWEQKLTASMHRTERRNEGSGFSLPTAFEGALYEVDWQNVVRPADWFTIVLGGQYEHETAVFDSSSAGLPTPRSDAQADNGAVSMDHQVALGEYVDVTAGLRVDMHERYGAHLTGRTTAALRVGQTGLLLHSSLANGFKAPTLSQLFDDSFGSANPDLEPERSLGWDIGARQRLGSRASLAITWFGNEIDDLILAVFDPATVTFRNQNVESVRTRGIELKLEALLLDDRRWLGDLSTQLAYTYIRTRAQEAASFGVVDGGRLLRRPRDEVFSAFSWTPVPRLELTVGVLYVGERLDLDPVSFQTFEADSYVKVDLAVTIEVTDRLKLFGRTENIGNTQYEEVAGFETSGRAYYGGFRIDFR
ncbi:MAG: TonB-dependent receptor [Myxococcota bacterium]|nr:TonB-dependent receptor [Myxococcota bacterium]